MSLLYIINFFYLQRYRVLFRKSFMVSTAVIFLLSYTLLSTADDTRCILKVGYEINQPLVFIDKEKKKLTGLDVELMERIAAISDCSVEWVKMPWKSILASVKIGKILLATSAKPSKERSLYSNFTVPYRTEVVKLYIRKSDRYKIKANSLKDFLAHTQLKVGYNDSYEYSQEVHDLIRDKEFKDRFEAVIDSALSFYKLKGNLVDGVMMDSLTADKIIKLNNWENQFEPYSFIVCSNPLSLMVSKKADPTGQHLWVLNQAISKLESDQQIKQIYKKYSD